MGLLAIVLATPTTAWVQPVNRGRPPLNAANTFAGGVGADGRIVPAGGVIRVTAPIGPSGEPIVGQLLVKQGDWVEAGQLLAVTRDQPLLKAQLEAASRDRDSAAAALAQAQATQARVLADFQAQVTDLEGRVAIAEATAHHAALASSIALDEAKREADAADAAVEAERHIQTAEQAAATANVTIAQVQLDAISSSRTTERKIATAQVAQAKAMVDQVMAETASQIDQLQAQADLAVLRQHQAEAALIKEPAPEDATALAPVQAEAQAAAASLAALRQHLDVVTNEQTALVATAQARLNSAMAMETVASTQLALCEVHAPTAGRILAIHANPGELVGPAGLLEMGDTREMYVDALVYVDDVPGVRLGQKALVTSSSLPSDGVTGQVVAISQIVAGNTLPSTDPTAFSDQPVVLVKVHLDNPAGAANLINGKVTVQFESLP